MKINQKTVQIALITFGIFLILATYFIYPKILKDKKLSEIKKEKPVENIISVDNKEANVFENVEYQGIYDLNNNFTIKSEKAHIFNEEPDMVYMKYMSATIYMSDGRVITITSDSGKYNKINYDCFFEKNVKAQDHKTVILSDNLDLLSTEDYASVYNNVILTSDNGSLKADKINYNFDTELYEISMFDDNAVKIKITK
tara:strand:+ start:1200 stop:1796 length:597 start_codon:yes stop_codon:yes gene_type:complete